MRKTITAFIFSVSLLLSVVGPTILTALELSQEDIAWISFAEEESKENVNQCAEDAKQLFQQHFDNAMAFSLLSAKRSNFYLEFATKYTEEINLPPPEKFI